jgi:hypothetical protein
MIPINLAFEDILSEAVLRKILLYSKLPYVICHCYSKNGFDYLKKTIKGFNNGAKSIAYLVLTDLDKGECAPELIEEWLPAPRHPNLLFRVAVREVEAWLLADRVNFSKFLGIRENLIPSPADNISDPKRFLIDLTKKSKKRSLKNDIVPREESTAKQGPNYNEPLIKFVNSSWQVELARHNSPSLERTVMAIKNFRFHNY